MPFASGSLVTKALSLDLSRSITRSAPRRARCVACTISLPPKPKPRLFVVSAESLYDAILDLRESSPTFGQSFGAELSAENRRMMYVPKGFAHGFFTLADDTEAFYFVDEFYAPECERGIRWDDPRFAVKWPGQPTVLSDKDSGYRDFDPAWHLSA